jgi:dihydrofolate reductase
MKLILAVSSDGYLARGPTDDMAWTGRIDKFTFKLLTLSDGCELLAGSTTHRQLPSLPGRPVRRITRKINEGVSLKEAYRRFPDAWLLGGPTVALEALKRGMVDRAFICRVPYDMCTGDAHLVGDVSKAVSAASVLAWLPEVPSITAHHNKKSDNAYSVDMYTPEQSWPGR